MKKKLLIIFIIVLWNNLGQAFPFVKLDEYLKNNSASDPSVTIYLFNRCAALSQFLSAISYERNKDLAEQYQNRQFAFLMSATKIQQKLFNVTEEKAMEDLTKIQRQMAELYREEGNRSYISSGSHLNESINVDRNICDYFGKK